MGLSLEERNIYQFNFYYGDAFVIVDIIIHENIARVHMTTSNFIFSGRESSSEHKYIVKRKQDVFGYKISN